MFILASLQVLAGILRPHVPGPGEEKSTVRSAWEMGHRISGLALLACGFWQMREGILLYAKKYSVSSSDENKLATAYWVWIAIMTAAILLGLVSLLTGKRDEAGNPEGVSGAQAAVSIREGEREGGTEVRNKEPGEEVNIAESKKSSQSA
jgi:hypothetical protein